MDIISNLIMGFGSIANADTMFTIFLGTLLGIVIGAMPGIAVTTGVAIFLPMTFHMEPIPAFGFLLGIYCGGMYGGSIPAVLINTPGTSSAAATVLDGYPMAKNGQAYKALQMALYASLVGGLLSCIALVGISPFLARVALTFGPTEYFALGLFGLTVVASLSSGNMARGLIAACIGLFLSYIGLDPINASTRMTFDSVSLMGGFELIPTLMGLFAVSEIIMQSEQIYKQNREEKIVAQGGKCTLKDIKGSMRTIIRGSVIGILIGILPATGGGTAAFISYNEAKRKSKNPEQFGKGTIEGVAASESANSAVVGGAMIPVLTLGIPADVVTAVMMGALMIQGLVPGPLLIAQEAETVFGIYAALIVSNFFMFFLGMVGIRWFYKVTMIPKSVLQPIVFAMCCIGTFAVSSRGFDVFSMFVMGIIGYLLLKNKIPLPPVLLALILGPIVETNLRRGLMTYRGRFLPFLSRPVTLVLLLLSTASVIFSFYREFKAAKIAREGKLAARTQNER